MKELQEIRNFIEKLKVTTKNYRIWSLNTDKSQDLNIIIKDMPIRVGKGIWSNYLLEEEIKLELGGNNNPSTTLVICSSDIKEKTIHDGRISLIGPDIVEISEKYHPFGLIVFIGGRKISSSHLNKIKRIINFTDEIEGVLLRTSPRRYIIRISKEIFHRQVSFEHIGRALIFIFKKNFPNLIENIELVFITTDNNIIEQLENFGRDVNKIFSEALRDTIYKYAKKYEKLREDCDLDEECDVCDNQIICEDIQEIIEIREKLKNKKKNKSKEFYEEK